MEKLLDQMTQLQAEYAEAVAACSSEKDLADVRVRFLGKKGALTRILRGMKDLSAEDRPIAGAHANELRSIMETELAEKRETLARQALEKRMTRETLDITLPGKIDKQGVLHPLSRVMDKIVDAFIGLGFHIAEGPEIEFIRYNFDWLEIPEDHPSRDESDTFYISDDIVLRTQTSPVQIRTMLSSKPPLRIICPGRVYRPDAMDATHSPIFYQIEGLAIDQGITMSDLVGCLSLFAQATFGEDSEIRLRPHHFPFTEPSCEVDISCPVCHGVNSESCRMCKGEGFIELLGGGMVHPDVLKNGGIDPEKYSGFAFGIGLERTAMSRFGIKDIRYLYENDLRFLTQFQA